MPTDRLTLQEWWLLWRWRRLERKLQNIYAGLYRATKRPDIQELIQKLWTEREQELQGFDQLFTGL